MRTLAVTPQNLGFAHAAQLLEIKRNSTEKTTGKPRPGRRLFILSEPLGAQDALHAARGRWGIENKKSVPTTVALSRIDHNFLSDGCGRNKASDFRLSRQRGLSLEARFEAARRGRAPVSTGECDASPFAVPFGPCF
jgi:hypothetical protein